MENWAAHRLEKSPGHPRGRGHLPGQDPEMQSYLDLYGGYSAETWERDIIAHETILDGEDLRRGIIGANQARMDGFLLIRGRAEGPGGAIFCDSSSPIITNNRFESYLPRPRSDSGTTVSFRAESEEVPSPASMMPFR